MADTVSRNEPEEGPVRSFVGCDSHRKYSVFVAMDEQGKTTAPLRVVNISGRSFVTFCAISLQEPM
jgi:hypothetical protein